MREFSLFRFAVTFNNNSFRNPYTVFCVLFELPTPSTTWDSVDTPPFSSICSSLHFTILTAEEYLYQNQWGGISLLNAVNLSERVLMSNVTYVSIEYILHYYIIYTYKYQNRTKFMCKCVQCSVCYAKRERTDKMLKIEYEILSRKYYYIDRISFNLMHSIRWRGGAICVYIHEISSAISRYKLVLHIGIVRGDFLCFLFFARYFYWNEKYFRQSLER